jgi:hypothetical protein
MGKDNSREVLFTTETRGYREKPDKNVRRFLRLMITARLHATICRGLGYYPPRVLTHRFGQDFG